MVVGLAKYQNQQEAFPLDKKTLQNVALRSFLSGISFNSESSDSIGWLWAIQPALRKIHSDEEDCKLAMGHNLEHCSASSPLAPLAMGVVLSLEQQKCDLETIRSARSIATYTCDAIGKMLVYYLFIPLLALSIIESARNGSIMAVAIYCVVLFLLQVILRFVSIQYGYKHGMRVIEKLQKNAGTLKKSMMIAGSFMLGAILVALGSGYAMQIAMSQDNSSIPTIAKLLPGVLTVVMGLLLHYLLVKKNFSMGKCVIVVVLVSFIIALVQNII